MPFFFFKCSRQLSDCHLQLIYITGWPRMCVSLVLKWLFSAGDRCVADCGVATRLKSSPPTWPVLLPLTLSISQDGEGGHELRVIYEPTGERWEEPAIPCQEAKLQGERLRTLKCHFLQFTTTLSPLPPGQLGFMKNGPHYRIDPCWSLPLTPTSYKWPLATF